MGIESVLMIAVLVVGFYMAWNIGANDVGNAMGTSVGSGALTLRNAVIVAAIFEFTGAFLIGSHVSQTVMTGIFDTTIFTEIPQSYIHGMLGALLAAGVWLQIASYFGWPVSTTHTIIGSMVGVGIAVGGTSVIHWDTVTAVVLSWIISPVLGATLSFLAFSFLRRQIFYRRYPIKAAIQFTPWIVASVFFVLSLFMFFKGLKNLHLDLNFQQACGVSFSVALLAGLIARICVNRIQVEEFEEDDDVQDPHVIAGLEKAVKHLKRVKRSASGDMRYQVSAMLHEAEQLGKQAAAGRMNASENRDYAVVERIFKYLQIMSACFMAFSHGANDVANAIGPMAGVLEVQRLKTLTLPETIPPWILAFGGFGIVVGLATWGWRVIDTIGRKITELTPSRGFAAEIGAATTIVLASRLGLPVSTTHILIGSVFGVGLARGVAALNLNIIRDIVISWIVTVPAGAIMSVLFFMILEFLFA